MHGIGYSLDLPKKEEFLATQEGVYAHLCEFCISTARRAQDGAAPSLFVKSASNRMPTCGLRRPLQKSLNDDFSTGKPDMAPANCGMN
ncbi:hypothetical protein [Magnetofaba australis]|uniref:hypothetical protein n=1 Tax=Magnetofaba australis TaxID=1472297 RepID=UPI00117F430C|nr:hypothetical protein [Magnetofaba australis]